MRFEEIPETNCFQDETGFTDDNDLNGEHNLLPRVLKSNSK